MFGRKKQPRGLRLSPREAGRTQVFSYYSSRSEDATNVGRTNETPKPRNPARGWWRQLPSILAVGVIIVSVLYATTLSPRPTVIIDNPDAKTQLHATAEYEQAAQKLLSSSLLNRSKATINTDELATKLQAQFPELEHVTITIPFVSHKPVINLSLALPRFIIDGAGGSYVIDGEGRAITTPQKLGKSPSLTVIHNQTGLTMKLNEHVLPQQSVDFLTSFVTQLKAKNLTVQAITLPPSANEADFKVNGLAYFIKTDMGGDPRLQAGRLLAVKGYLDAAKTPPAQYIDVRVEDRAYYQ